VNGEVLAWVGSPEFWASPDGQTDMVASPRQPGSALKPFVYGLAFDRGFGAATVLPDIPRSYATSTGPYQPRNYDRRFRGPVRAREALASSYNVPAVELASRLGVGSVLNTLRLAGFESLRRDADYYGLGLALGNGDVTLIEMANAYRALANGGLWRPWTWHASASPGVVSPTDTHRVLSRISSAIVLDILSDAEARVPGFGTLTPFDFPFPTAVKTGTSRHFTDNWAVATTLGFTVAVWAGNFNGRPMQGVSGITGAGPLLHRAVMLAATRLSPGQLTAPASVGAVPARVCRLSGLLATSACPQMTEWFEPARVPRALDDWELEGHINLPPEYAEWAQQGLMEMGPARRKTTLVAAADSVEPPPTGSRFRIVSPLDGDRYAIPSGVDEQYATIALRASVSAAVRWSIDGAPYRRERWQLTPGDHVIRAQSPLGERAEVRITVER
jgi:penicillin-binding protein 1C